MKRRVLTVAVAGVVALALAGSLAWAQGVVLVDVPFAFVVSGKEMPAGKYRIEVEGLDGGRLVVRSVATGVSAIAPVLERLADVGGKEAKVVFDKVDGTSYLSEIHVPGEDGFLVGIATRRETHVVLPAKK